MQEVTYIMLRTSDSHTKVLYTVKSVELEALLSLCDLSQHPKVSNQ
jgi:hypothetical protein